MMQRITINIDSRVIIMSSNGVCNFSMLVTSAPSDNRIVIITTCIFLHHKDEDEDIPS